MTWSPSTISNLALTDDNGQQWAYTSGGVLVEASSSGVIGVAVTVTLSYKTGGSAPTLQQKLALVGNHTVTIGKSSRVKTIDRTTVGDPGENLFKDATVTFTLNIAAETGALSGNSKTFVVAYEGAKATEDYEHKDSGALNGTLSIASIS